MMDDGWWMKNENYELGKGISDDGEGDGDGFTKTPYSHSNNKWQSGCECLP